MPRAAPGDNAREAMRRKFPKYLQVPGNQPARNPVGDACRSGMDSNFLRSKIGTTPYGTCTQLLSVYRVERCRLGKVVSMVVDCRPPPPGNPYLPTAPQYVAKDKFGRQMDSTKIPNRIEIFTSMIQRSGGLNFQVRLYISFNSSKQPSNLKILNKPEYFKNNCSYYYCIEKKAVLEFGSFSLPHVRVIGSESPIYSDYKCSRNAGITYALPVL